MPESELISASIKKDKAAQQQLFEQNYGALAAIALRYSKNKSQADDLLNKGFSHLFAHLSGYNAQNSKTLQEWLKHEFIVFALHYIKNIRSEYYVASTVRITEPRDNSYDLFFDSEIIDYSQVDFTILVKSLQQLVPAQRLVFNMHVIDGFSLKDISNELETSEQTVKSNLEKGRFNLQKNIEKNIKASKHEQPV
ncbi:MAG: sigma-70 family RNA polymerase sigma factor [Bacteroidetes bacterium]|nr:sigma-70 family RNA polymerase sigma factor [Bacteroidota bacterium]